MNEGAQQHWGAPSGWPLHPPHKEARSSARYGVRRSVNLALYGRGAIPPLSGRIQTLQVNRDLAHAFPNQERIEILLALYLVLRFRARGRTNVTHQAHHLAVMSSNIALRAKKHACAPLTARAGPFGPESVSKKKAVHTPPPSRARAVMGAALWRWCCGQGCPSDPRHAHRPADNGRDPDSISGPSALSGPTA